MVELTDTQNQPDERGIAIDRVGVKELQFPLEVLEKGGGKQRTVSTVAMAVDLPHHFKGTHMSRFVEVLHSHGTLLDVNNMSGLTAELLDRLEAERAHVSFRFPFFITKAAPVTGREGVMSYEVSFEVEASGQERDLMVTVHVPVATLCPCSKAISARGAHNQRGLVSFSVKFNRPIWIEDLIRLVEDSASCELYSVLKRPDEKEVTERAYDNPVFVEDLVRNVAARARAQDDIRWFRVEAENFESIHNHNAYAVVELPGGSS
ncbi:MAG: GTP cyclohydrolase FolE2 [Verrucomicrobiota bacterium JB023]|nr:GTP cyclohydrolase FolE2 [Verrucomicrobiota bacterium JB023]